MSSLADPAQAAAYVAQVAAKRGWRVNPDQALVADITQGLATQAGRWGRPYCPCRDVDGTAADADVVCPCRYAPEDLAEFGQCFCGLFVTPEARGPVGSIPERRPS